MTAKTKEKGKAWPDRPCAYVKCKKPYPPSAENQKFHDDDCRVMAFYLRKIEGPGGEQVRWEKEVRRIIAQQEMQS